MYLNYFSKLKTTVHYELVMNVGLTLNIALHYVVNIHSQTFDGKMSNRSCVSDNITLR